MSRLPVISVEEMDERQRPIYDEIVSGKRGLERFSAPFNIWIHSPDFLKRLEKVGSYLRGDTPLPPPPNRDGDSHHRPLLDCSLRVVRTRALRC